MINEKYFTVKSVNRYKITYTYTSDKINFRKCLSNKYFRHYFLNAIINLHKKLI